MAPADVAGDGVVDDPVEGVPDVEDPRPVDARAGIGRREVEVGQGLVLGVAEVELVGLEPDPGDLQIRAGSAMAAARASSRLTSRAT